MGKSLIYFIASSVLAASIVSCGKQDEIYKQYVKAGGYDYPAKSLNLSYIPGYKNVIIKWEKPMDPSVISAKLYWDNYSESINIDYKEYPDGKVAIPVKDLEDRSYTFDVVNFDINSNKSLSAEITAAPYGDGWMVSRSERSVLSAMMDGENAVIVMSRATDEMIATRFRYKDKTGQWVELKENLKPGKDTVKFAGALQGKRFEYSSSYCPKNGKDTVWRSWLKSADGISYQLDGKRWTVAATQGQVFDENTPDKIFDGKNLSGCRYHSSKNETTKNIFPKILAVDTQAAAGNEFAFTAFRFCEHDATVSLRYIKNIMMYVGNKPYNPDDQKYNVNFGIPYITATLSPKDARQMVKGSQGAIGRYFSIVFTDSWSSADGYIDLWELIPYGYVPALAD